MSEKVELIPIEEIRILNPRSRNQRKFAEIVDNIKRVGLKKPIRVSQRIKGEDGDRRFDLVCGQGRIEAFINLGLKEIPAIVEYNLKEDRLLMSLIENMARRFPRPLDLINEIQRLKSLNYSNVEIGKKLGIADSMIGGLLKLSNDGEERLLQAAISGAIPLGVAIDIVKAETIEMQRELLTAYQKKELNQVSIRKVKKLIEQRRLFGKGRRRSVARHGKKRPNAETLVSVYREEAQRQKAMIRKNRICESRLVFVRSAFKQLLADADFRTVLKAEALGDMPKFIYLQCHE